MITISQSSRQDVHQQFGVPLSRIDVVYPGVDKVYRPLSPHEISKFRQQNNLPERFILHVGTLQPRKNIPVLLKAFARLRDPDLHLFLVGGKGWLYDDIFAQVEALQLTDRVHFTGYVPDETLPFWYNTALALVFPSVYEGFGMPVIEAMACGTPVIAANTSSLPEAAGSAALLFTPHNPEELADRIDTVLHNSGIWATMREQGWQQAQKFSWERAGRETAEIYQRALREL
ncbi:MAG: glycosyltransferase family 1 protein [Chloroflexi bacterium]|nr:MAG: glycosyltransferase family 1 protein [Chloroflexota bacterium]